MTTSPSRTFQSWSEIYQTLRAKAEASRGTVTVTTNDAPAATFPHTTSSDAFEILIVFDTAVHEHAKAPLVDRWITESDLLARAPDDSDEPYVGNRSFWEAVAIAAIELDRLHAPLPTQTSVDDAIEQLDEALKIQPQNPRHARGSPIVTAFSEPTWMAMATRQFEFFRTLRGEDATRLPFLPAVPATCNGDVLLLATYWSEQLTRAGGNASDTFHRLLFSSWRDAVQDVMRHTSQAPPHHLYPLNAPFWRALLFLAVRSDACTEAPTPWTFELPVARPVPVRDTAPVDARATLELQSAPSWGDAKPLLYAGLGLGGLAALHLVLRFRRAPHHTPAAKRPQGTTPPIPRAGRELIGNAIRRATLILSLLKIYILGLDDWLSGTTMQGPERK